MLIYMTEKESVIKRKTIEDAFERIKNDLGLKGCPYSMVVERLNSTGVVRIKHTRLLSKGGDLPFVDRFTYYIGKRGSWIWQNMMEYGRRDKKSSAVLHNYRKAVRAILSQPEVWGRFIEMYFYPDFQP